ncbi:MAG: tRNA (guanosine(37)-N1)-methyltransferase TrmD [Vicinamibacterales bacterium]
MRFDVITIFPDMVRQAVGTGIVGRAIDRKVLEVEVHDLRGFTTDRHHVVDDVPYGGGPGMVLKPEPLMRALDAVGPREGAPAAVVMMSPQGTLLTQRVVERLAAGPRLVLLCGRYEGVDERVRALVDEEISIGDYVLSGGELPALVVIDAVARLVPGVVGDEQSVVEESFSRGLLDHPHYTRPAAVEHGGSTLKVPEVLLSGNHADIRRWRKREALARTLARRPDLLQTAELDDEERQLLREVTEQRQRQ